MRKTGIIVFILVLFSHTIISGLGSPVTAMEKEWEQSMLTNVTLMDNEGVVIDADQNPEHHLSLEAVVTVSYDWSLIGLDVSDGDIYSFVLPSQLKVQKEQQGNLMANQNIEVGTFQVATDRTVTVTFNQEVENHADARGKLTIETAFNKEIIGDNETVSIPFPLSEQEKVINISFQEDFFLESEENQREAEANLEGEANPEAGTEEIETEVKQTDDEDVQETLNAENEEADEVGEQISSASTEITENIITKVELYQRLEDGTEIELEPGQEIEVDNPYDKFQVTIQYLFALPNDHNYDHGSTYTIEIPDVFEVLPAPEPIDLQSEDGTVFGSFIVNNEGNIVITFNENIKNNSEISGYIDLWSEFDAHYAGSAEEEITFPVSGDASITFPIKFRPNATAIDKKGIPNKAYNTETIEWSVDFNKNLQTIEHATLDDEATEGDHVFKEGSFKVYKLHMNADGTIDESKTTEITDHEFGSTFPLDLGTIDSAYRVVYETEIQDNEGTSYKNKAILAGDNVEPVEAEATVTVKRGEPLEKRAAHYDEKTQTITWEVNYNYDEKVIPQNKAKLTDVLGENQKLVYNNHPEDGFTVYKMGIDPDTGEEVGEEEDWEIVTNYVVNENEDGFVLSFADQITNAYKIKYKTTAENRVEEGKTITNTMTDEFRNSDQGSQWMGQQVFRKSNDDNANYDDKTTSWTMMINGDEYTMNDVEVVDTLPKGFTPRDIAVSHDGETWTKDTDYTWVFGENHPQELTIAFNKTITKQVYITYTTDIDFDETEAHGDFKNNAVVTWKTDGDNGSGEKDGSATFEPDDYTKANGFKGGTYNLETKVIDWEIGVNYNKATLDNTVIEDIIIGDQNFDINSIKVYHMELTGGPYGYDYDEEVPLTLGDANNDNEYEVEEFTGPNDEPAFRVKLGDIRTPYLITYQTDLKDQLIDKKYENTATVKSDNQEPFDLEASVSPSYGGQYTKKNAEQDKNNPRVVHWDVNINFTQSTVSNVSLSDTPSKNQTFLKDSFKLYDTNVSPNSIGKGAELEEGKDYTLEFVEDEDGIETFTLTFIEDKIDRAYVLEYDTYILYKDDGYIENDAKFHGEETEDLPTDDGVREQIELSGIGGGIDGKVGSLEVTKVDYQ